MGKFGNMNRGGIMGMAAGLWLASLSVLGMAQGEWSEPTQILYEQPVLGRVLDSTNQDELAVAVDPAGNTLALWTETVETLPGISELVVARSTSGGAAYGGGKAVVTDLPFGDTDLVYAGDGIWVLAYCVLEGPAGPGGIFVKRSSDLGNTWSDPQPMGGPGALGVQSLQVSSDGNGTLVAVLQQQLYRSTDYGASWAPVTAVPASWSTTGFLVTVPAISNNGGDRWVMAFTNRNLGNNPFEFHYTQHVLMSADDGATWEETRSANLGYDLEFYALAMQDMKVCLVVSSATYIATERAVLSDDGGATWQAPVPVRPSAGPTATLSLAQNNGRWVLAVQAATGTETLIYESPDRVTWTLADQYFGISQFSMAPLGHSGITAVYKNNVQLKRGDIWSLTSGETPAGTSDYNMVVATDTLPKLKVNAKTGEAKASWKAILFNEGPAESAPTFLQVRHRVKSEGYEYWEAVGVIPVKPVKPPKPGKLAKAKKVKIKVTLPNFGFYQGMDHFVDAVLMPGYNEEQTLDNSVSEQLLEY